MDKKSLSLKLTFFSFISILLISVLFFRLEFEESNRVLANKKEAFLEKLTPFQLKNVKNKLSDMTLREKIAQMVISSTLGENYNENSAEFKLLKKLCVQTKVGGFIFFKGTSDGYVSLSNKLQELSNTPLLISADFERGTGMRVTDGTLFPNNMALGATNNPQLAYEMGLCTAGESRALGVYQNYAPVCDVNNNPNNPIINVRSFGENPELVSKMSGAMIKGLQDGKIIATAKHFPGHGDTEIDSHKDLPVLNFSIDRLNKIELVPFKNAIANNVISIMIAHLAFPELEPQPNIPASLSKNIVDGLLTKQLEFEGLVVTDALNMKGITKYFSTSEVAVMCVNAGIDLILMPIDEDETIEAIEKAVNKGTITVARINKSVEKILKAKEWLGLFKNKYASENEVPSKVNTPESNALAQRIADESITLVTDRNNILPLKSGSERTIVFNMSDGSDNINSDYFSDKIKEVNNNTTVININSEISAGKISELLSKSQEYDVIITAIYAKVRYGTGKISILPSQVELLNRLDKSEKKLIVISFGNPYLMKEFPEISNYICAYGDADVSIKAAIKAIYGDIKFKGVLPVSINDDFESGMGIFK
jgi:beta-N-acetylhexosaminidase